MELKGKRFGHWLVTQKTGDRKWACRCDCGVMAEIHESLLISGVSTSCGCRKGRAKDLSGLHFGKLEAIEPLPNRAVDNSIRWLCLCECGEYTIVSSNKLRMGHTTSCGCMKTKPARMAKTFVDGTCAEQVMSDKIPKNNTSGFKGVSRKRNKWQAYITYANDRHNLGTFVTMEDAVAARRRAEERVRNHLRQLIVFK